MGDMGILRVNPKIKDEAKKIAKKNHMTLTRFTEQSLRESIDNMGFTYDYLIELIEKTPSLMLYKDTLKEELKGAPRDLIKNLIKVIEADNIRFFRLSVPEIDSERLKEIVLKDMLGMVIIAKIRSEEEVDKTAEKIISNFIGNINLEKERFFLAMKRDFSLKENSELLVFVSYKKEDDKNAP